MIQWQGYDWLTNERWGQVHPANPIAWHDPSAVSIDDDGYLRLKTKPNPKDQNPTHILNYQMVLIYGQRFGCGHLKVGHLK